MDIREILKVLPHRYPFLLVDRVLEADERRFKALKNLNTIGRIASIITIGHGIYFVHFVFDIAH